MSSSTSGLHQTSAPAPPTTPNPPTTIHDASDPPTSPSSPMSPRSTTSQPSSPLHSQHVRTRTRTNTGASRISQASSRLRSASLKLMEADVPLGAWAASASATSKAPSLAEIRRGSFGQHGWTKEGQLEEQSERRASASETSEARRRRLSRTSSGFSARSLGSPRRERRESSAAEPFPSVEEEIVPKEPEELGQQPTQQPTITDGTTSEKPSSESSTAVEPTATTTKKQLNEKGKEVFPAEQPQPNGYVPPPKLTWTTSFIIGLKAFWNWILTPLGFFVTIYGLNVVAWGGMLFLLLCNAAPAMCHPTCNDLYSPRRIWIEIDSQILNALFCVTGFGLIPWRFRDLYWLLVYRIGLVGRGKDAKMVGLRRLAGIHRGWFRLAGSSDYTSETPGTELDSSNPSVPLPLTKRLEPPLTGVRAPPTPTWKLDFVIWCNVSNTFLQACLCGFMWGMNRFKRPSWATGLFIGLACVVAGIGGIMMFVEGKKVKRYEGVAPNERQKEIMRKQGVTGVEGQELREEMVQDGTNAGQGLGALEREKRTEI